MNTINQITQSHLSVFVFDKANNNPIKRMPIYAEIAAIGRRISEVVDANTIDIASDIFGDRDSKAWLVEALEKYLNASYFNHMTNEERNNLIQTLVDKIAGDIQALPNATKAKKKAIVDETVKRVAAELDIPAPEPQPEFETISAYPLGMLATDHIGYLSYSLINIPKNPFPMYNNLQFAVYLYPMGKESARIDALQQARITPDVILTKLEIEKPVFESNLRALNLPAMQNPDLADWYMSPGSFAALPSALIGADGCENLFPANFATQEFRFRQVVRISDVPQVYNIPAEYRYGYVDEYKVSLVPIGHSLGEIQYSLPLAPGESVKLAIIDWSRTDSTVRTEDTEFAEKLMHDTHRDRSITETVQSALSEWQRGGNVQGGANVSLFGIISIGGGGGYSTSSGSRDLAAANTQKLSDSFSQASSALREFHSTVVVQSKQEEKENIQTRTFTNYNHSHTLTILYYEILRHFRLVTEWVNRKPVALLPFGKLAFTDDLIIKYRHLLEPNLIVKSLTEGLNALEKLQSIALDDRINPKPIPQQPQQPREYRMYTIGFQFQVGDGDWETTGPVRMTAVYNNGTTVTLRYMGDDNINKQEQLFNNADATPSILLNPDTPIVWGSLRSIQMKLDDNDNVSLRNVGISANGNFPGTIVLRNFGPINLEWIDGNVWQQIPTNNPNADFPAPPPNKTPEQQLSLQENYAINKLKEHISQFNEHYNRVIYLNKDVNATAEWFETHNWGQTQSKIIDNIEPIALEVFGSYIAYPLLEHNQGSANLSASSIQAKAKTEKLVSLPTRGVFAEGKLGHCNISEEIDETRFWKWEEHPIPFEAPGINPVTPVTPQPIQQGVQPSAFPNSSINIVSPTAAPDPQGLSEALKVLATPNIFRDMAGRQETAELLKGLANETVSMADAANKAKEIQAKYGKNLDASNGGGALVNAGSSGNAVKDIQQLSDANKNLVGYASPAVIKQNANKISDSYGDLAELVKQQKAQELDERIASTDPTFLPSTFPTFTGQIDGESSSVLFAMYFSKPGTMMHNIAEYAITGLLSKSLIGIVRSDHGAILKPLVLAADYSTLDQYINQTSIPGLAWFQTANGNRGYIMIRKEGFTGHTVATEKYDKVNEWRAVLAHEIQHAANHEEEKFPDTFQPTNEFYTDVAKAISLAKTANISPWSCIRNVTGELAGRFVNWYIWEEIMSAVGSTVKLPTAASFFKRCYEEVKSNLNNNSYDVSKYIQFLIDEDKLADQVAIWLEHVAHKYYLFDDILTPSLKGKDLFLAAAASYNADKEGWKSISLPPASVDGNGIH